MMTDQEHLVTEYPDCFPAFPKKIQICFPPYSLELSKNPDIN